MPEGAQPGEDGMEPEPELTEEEKAHREVQTQIDTAQNEVSVWQHMWPNCIHLSTFATHVVFEDTCSH